MSQDDHCGAINMYVRGVKNKETVSFMSRNTKGFLEMKTCWDAHKFINDSIIANKIRTKICSCRMTVKSNSIQAFLDLRC